MEKEMILLKNLSIGYRQKTDSRKVLKDINLSIFSGELICLLGPNGIGKSTLLRTLSGLLPKLSGTIMINSRALEEYSEKELSKQVGVVLTDHPQLRNMRVEELVALGRAPYTNFFGGLSSEDKVFVDEAISLVGIDKLRGRMIRELSDGERQKVMIARALAQQTPVIILDEPTAFLDFPSKVEVMKLLRNLAHDMHKTILLSTHDLDLAVRLADTLLQVADSGIQKVDCQQVEKEMSLLLDI
jgi:iron complex transport system ATP-binding protein